MTESERNQIKPQLLKCARENENKSTFTGYVIVSAVCKAAVERIEELEQENTQLCTNYEKQKEINKELVDDITAARNEIGRAQKTALYNLDGWRKADAEIKKTKYLVKDLLLVLDGRGGIDFKNEVLQNAEQFLREGEK